MRATRLPANANGIISEKTLEEGKRAIVKGNSLQVTVAWEIKESKGFKFKDTFKHNGIKTYPWAAVWNVVMVLVLGISLGLMAEGFTDVISRATS